MKEPAVKADEAWVKPGKGRTKARAEADETRLEAWAKAATKAPAEAATEAGVKAAAESAPVPATAEAAAVNHDGRKLGS